MSQADQSRAKPVILIVDDEPLLRMDLAGTLEDAGYEVLEAADSFAAIALLQGHADIRMLLTDVHLPGEFNGLELAHVVAEQWPMIAIMIMSGVAKPKTEALPRHAHFMSKPFNPVTALAIIANSTRSP